MIFYRTFEHGLAPAWNAVTATERDTRLLAVHRAGGDRCATEHRRGVGIALLMERGPLARRSVARADRRPAVRDLPRGRGAPLLLVYGRTGWFGIG